MKPVKNTEENTVRLARRLSRFSAFTTFPELALWLDLPYFPLKIVGMSVLSGLMLTACSERQISSQASHSATLPVTGLTAAPEQQEAAKAQDWAAVPAATASTQSLPAAPPAAAPVADASLIRMSPKSTAMANGITAQRAMGGMRPMPTYYPIPSPPPESQENYQGKAENEVKATQSEPVSTLSLDVDTGSYSNLRRMLRAGQLPPVEAVRIEEMLNYFPYGDTPPPAGHPFSVTTEVSAAPWQSGDVLLRVGVRAVDVKASQQPPANLVFLVDVSGSMNEPNKLPLAKASLRLLTQRLRPQDRVSLVVYAGRTEVVLPSTPASDKATILAAIDQLNAAGSTNGEAALKLAYQQAQAHRLSNGINRILLLTDGDFNVGVSSVDGIKQMVQRERERGISLSTFGFGEGNFNDAMMEQIADVGNGNYSYIDSLEESQKVLGEELTSTFNTVAKDVKLQIEFNPATVKEWRLIGYENRVLAEQDFKNDKVDAAEIGAGKSVVALYQLTPVGRAGLLGERRYGSPLGVFGKSGELGELRLRYKAPEGSVSREYRRVLPLRTTTPSVDMQFASAVAGFGQLLKHSKYSGNWTYRQAAQQAQQGLGRDSGGYRAELVKLIGLAEAISPNAPPAPVPQD